MNYKLVKRKLVEILRFQDPKGRIRALLLELILAVDEEVELSTFSEHVSEKGVE